LTDSGPLAALEEIRERRRDAEASGWGLASSADVPRLLKAVEVALRHHRQQETANGIPVCPRCSRAEGQFVKAPCPEVLDITRELTGGEDR